MSARKKIVQLTETTQAEIDKLIREAHEEHYQCLATFKKSLEHGMRCGERLNQLAKLVPWGMKGEWLDKNVKLSRNTCDRYRYLAKHRSVLEAITPNLGEITLDAAHDLIARELKRIRTANRATQKKKHKTEAGSGNVRELTESQRRTHDLDDDDEFSEGEFEEAYDALPLRAQQAIDHLDSFLKSGDAEAIHDFWRIMWLHRDLQSVVTLMQAEDASEVAVAVAAE